MLGSPVFEPIFSFNWKRFYHLLTVIILEGRAERVFFYKKFYDFMFFFVVLFCFFKVFLSCGVIYAIPRKNRPQNPVSLEFGNCMSHAPPSSDRK